MIFRKSKFFVLILISSFLFSFFANDAYATVTAHEMMVGDPSATAVTDNWIAPPGVTSVKVEAWGGGGTGGSGTGNSGASAGGGAGGQFAFDSNITVTGGSTYAVTIASTPAASANGVVAGQDTQFVGCATQDTHVCAKGGPGGLTSSGTSSTGGVGATTSGIGGTGEGTTVFAGGSGGGGTAAAASGGGGGGAGTGGTGNAGVTSTQGGAKSVGGGAGGAGTNSNAAVNPGSNAGGGGSGGKVVSGNGNNAGGVGGQGRLDFTYSIADTYPAIVDVVTGKDSGNAASRSITMPSSITAGDLLLIVYSQDATSVGASSIASGGWTELGDTRDGQNVVSGAIYYKIAAGGDTATVDTDGGTNQEASWIVYQIRNAGIPTATSNASAGANSTNSDPATHTPPSYGSQNYLWLATRSGDASSITTSFATDSPSSYSSLINAFAATTGGAHTSASRIYTTATSENPGAFTSATEGWVTWTIGIPPIATVLGDGTDGSGSTIAPGASATEIGRFSLISSKADTVTALNVTLAGDANAYKNIATVDVQTTGGSSKCSSSSWGSDNVVELSSCAIATTDTSTDYKIMITPKAHDIMDVPASGISVATTATVTSITATNTTSGTDTDSATITVDNGSPAAATSLSGTAGNAKNTLNWTTTSGETTNSVVLRWASGSAGSEVPAEGKIGGTAYAAGDAITTATVACIITSQTTATPLSKIDGTGGSSGCTTSALTNGQAYTYKVFEQDAQGNFNTGTSIGTFTPNAVTLGDGTDGSNSTIGPGGSATEIDRFSLSDATGTDTVTAMNVTLAGNASAYTNIATVEVKNTADNTTYCSSSSWGSDNIVELSSCTVPVTTTPTDFIVKITPKTHANMPAVPGASYATTATVTSITTTNATTGTDTDSATITVDNASPAGVTSSTVTAGNAQNTLAWTNPADSDFTTGGTVVVLHSATAAIAGVPTEGTTYSVGNNIVKNYYFDASDAATSDPQSAWSNDANAFDSDDTPSTNTNVNVNQTGSVSVDYLLGEGTTAPTSGGTITQVRARMYAGSSSADPTGASGHAAIYSNALGELLGTVAATIGSQNVFQWSSYTTLSTPSGGWTWQKVNDLETKIYAATGASQTVNVYKVEVEVTTDETVGCVVTGSPPTTSCTDSTSISNGTAYYYKIFTQDSRGNYDAGATPTGSPVTPLSPLTTLGDGTDGSSSTIAPEASATEIDRFSIATNTGTDSITALTVTLAPSGAYNNIAKVEVKTTGGSDVCTDVDNPGSVTVDFSCGSLTATTTPTDYKIMITPKTHASMPIVGSGLSYATTATVTNWTGTNSHAGTDTDSATITVDNLSPGEVSAATASAGVDSHIGPIVELEWTNPAPTDFSTTTISQLTQGSSSGTSADTASISPTLGGAVLVEVNMRSTDLASVSSEEVSVDGAGLDWEQIGSNNVYDASSRSLSTLWIGSGTPSSGALTIGTDSNRSMDNIIWSVVEVLGPGSNPVIQVAPASVVNDTSISASLGSFADADNITLFMAGSPNSNPTWTGEGGYSVISTNPSVSLAEYKGSSDTSPSATMSQSTTAGGHAIEIKGKYITSPMNVTSGGAGGGTNNYSTASISAQNNVLYLMLISGYDASGVGVPTSVEGAGLTFEKIEDTTYSSDARFSLWRAMATSGASSDNIDIDFQYNQFGASWSLVAFSGVDTSGTNGSGAVAQLDQDAGTTGGGGDVSLDFDEFFSSQDFTYGGLTTYGSNTLNLGSGFSGLNFTNDNGLGQQILAEFGQNEDSVTGSQDPFTYFGVYGAEIRTAEADPEKVILRSTSTISDVPVEGATYIAGDTIGTSTVVYVGRGINTTDEDVDYSTAYYYKIFTKDNNGNYSATGVSPTGSPVTTVDAPTPRLRYVNTGSSAGGDGTTNATVGANRAYASLKTAFENETDDLVSDNAALTIYVYGSSADTMGGEGVKIDDAAGWVTDRTRDITVMPYDSSQRAGTSWDTNKYRISTGFYFGAFGFYDDTETLYLTIDGIQMEQTSTSTETNERYHVLEIQQGMPIYLTVKNSFIRKVGASTPNSSVVNLLSFGGDSEINIINNIIQGHTVGIRAEGGGADIIIYNNTVYGASETGIWYDRFYSPRLFIKNNLIANSGDDDLLNAGDYTNGTIDISNNATEDDTSETEGLQNSTFTFVSAGTDFAITSADTGAKDKGANLSADATYAFSNDIIGNTRDIPWDIGAFEATTATPSTIYFRSSEADSSSSTGTTSSIIIAKPTGTEEGDLMVAHLGSSDTGGTTPADITGGDLPSGWALISGTNSNQTLISGTLKTYFGTYYKVAGASEPSSYTFTSHGVTSNDGYILTYANVSTSSPIHSALTGTNTFSSTATPTATGVTTTQDNEMLVTSFFSDGGNGSPVTWTAPTGMSERVDSFNVGIFDVLKTSAGASGDKQATASVSGTGTWVIIALNPIFTTTQQAYRFFANAASATPGSALANQDTAVTLANSGDQFRLRMLMRADRGDMPISGKTMKLQYAVKSGTCDTSFVGETYADVTTSTPISYYNTGSVADGDALGAQADLTDSGRTIVDQTYEELNNFTNSGAAVPSGQDGKWDFSLYDHSAPTATVYCLRAVESTGRLLDTYTQIPQVTIATASPAISLLHYRFVRDDGGESNASFAAAVDTAITSGLNILDKIRLRFLVTNTGGATATNYAYKLESSSGSCVSWDAVPASAAGNPPWYVSSQTSLTNGESTTNSSGLTDPDGGSFVAGFAHSSANTSSAVTLTQNQFTELEFGLRSTSGAAIGTLYCFRLTNDGSTTYFTYTVQPQITLSFRASRGASSSSGVDGGSSGGGTPTTGGNGQGGGSGVGGSGSGGGTPTPPGEGQGGGGGGGAGSGGGGGDTP